MTLILVWGNSFNMLLRNFTKVRPRFYHTFKSCSKGKHLLATHEKAIHGSAEKQLTIQKSEKPNV